MRNGYTEIICMLSDQIMCEKRGEEVQNEIKDLQFNRKNVENVCVDVCGG